MAHYLVTGGAGFIGSHICEALLEQGHAVRVLDNLSSGRLENLAGLDVELIQGDIRDSDACSRALGGVDGVFHEAAQVSVPASVEDPLLCYDVNVTGTLRLLEAARAAGVGRIVFAASSAAYGESEELPKHEALLPAPCSPYASGKVAGEHLLRTFGRCYGMHTVSLRYFNVFGPRQADDSPYSGVIAKFARILLDGGVPTIFGDGSQTRDFIYGTDVARANLLAMEAELPEPGWVFNIGGGEAISLNQLYETMAAEAGVRCAANRGPERAGDVRHSCADVELAAHFLGFKRQIPWREGLVRTLEWYRGSLTAAD